MENLAPFNAPRVAAKRNEGADTKRAADMYFDSKILVNFVFSPVAGRGQEEALEAEPIRMRQQHLEGTKATSARGTQLDCS